MVGVQNAVQNGIENLSGSSISSNSHPEDGYRYRARTAEELKQSANLVPQVRKEDLPPDDPETHEALHQQQRPAPPSPKAPAGWLI